MTGIGFMDVSAPRRSMHPSQIAQKPRDRAEISLAEYANAMAFDLPQLVLYTRVSQDIEEQIQKCKVEYQQLEEEVMKVTPELFSEYTSGNQEIQEELVVSTLEYTSRLFAMLTHYDSNNLKKSRETLG